MSPLSWPVKSKSYKSTFFRYRPFWKIKLSTRLPSYVHMFSKFQSLQFIKNLGICWFYLTKVYIIFIDVKSVWLVIPSVFGLSVFLIPWFLRTFSLNLLQTTTFKLFLICCKFSSPKDITLQILNSDRKLFFSDSRLGYV